MKLLLLSLLAPTLIATDSKAMVLVQGWTCDLTFRNASIPAPANGRRVIAVDLPGHGRSDKPRIDYTPALFARSVEAVMRHAEVSRAVPVVLDFVTKHGF